ncbi:protein smg8-like isoform X2 [Acanthaster planci]|uniref:Nonsense-mediated mRNA decay factor SMG8 n=1 Tax=Acanthaster planci TaxID=133434 RepID=A0A8B7ZUN9_ACAPL|nr:protein smg8-like isoform X2 [Acanthaster planci]
MEQPKSCGKKLITDDALNLKRHTPESNEKICVVGVFGKSQRAKGLMLNGITTTNSFQNPDFGPQKTEVDSCNIECFYDADSRVLYLHLLSIHDTVILSRICQQMQQNLSHADCHAFWKDHATSHARALLFMFTVCHLMVVVHPKNTFDTSYIQLFRALQNLREKLIPSISSLLKEASVGKECQTYGRLCTPRLLFVCQQTDMTEEELNSTASVSNAKSKYKRWSARKLLQHSLEDQIYRILRKSRILTNNLSHCLFTVPGNQAYVYFLDQQCLATDPVALMISELNKNFQPFKRGDTKSQPTTCPSPPVPSEQFQIFTDTVPSVEDTKQPDDLRSFLWEHVQLVLDGKGFDDGIGRGGVPHFEALGFSKWKSVSDRLYEFFMTDLSEPKIASHFNAMTSALDLDMRFSEARCNKVLPIATRTYQDGAPSHYTSTVHASRLTQAMKVFSQHARGPAFEKYANQLQAECQLFWQGGRQLCEVVSLTGHHCIHKAHLLLDSPTDPETEAVIPRMPHTNNNRTPCACNCGRTIGQRDDPFTLKLANYDFFQELEDRCCSKHKHHTFRLYEPKRRDSKVLPALAGQDQAKGAGKESGKEDGLGKMATEKLKSDNTASIPNTFSPALSLGQSGASDLLSHDAHSGLPGNSAASLLSMGDGVHDTIREKPVYYRESSTADYLQGMMCSTSPHGLLPLFSSWSLLCLGKASLYNPSKGLEQQPGFLRDCNFLVPWDIPIPKGSALDPSWPVLSDSAGASSRKGGKHRDKRGAKDSNTDPSIRAYIGNEYECPRGHRFICSGPDKIVKATGSGIVKDTGTKLVTSDMPLYFPCPCRTTKPPLGQLMRAFIVTPDVPLYIKLNPRLRPDQHPCPIFHPEVSEDGIILTGNSFWVLRFPYVYVDENGPVRTPTDNQPLPSAKLLRGMYLTTLEKPPDS